MIYKNNRKRNYVLFVLVCMLLSVIVAFSLLLTNGRSIDGGEIVSRGVIRFKIIPEDSKIFVNGEEKKLGNNLLQNLDLGINTIQVSKEGYTNWEKTVNVKKDIVTDIFVQLFPEQLKLEQLTSLDIKDISFNPETNTAFFVVLEDTSPDNIGIWKYKFTDAFIPISENKPEKFSRISQDLLKLITGKEFSIASSQNNDYILINIENTNYLISNSSEININAEVGFAPKNVSFYKNNLIIEGEDILLEYNISNTNLNLISYSPGITPNYCISKDLIYFLNKDFLYSYNGSESKLVEISNLIDRAGLIIKCPFNSTDDLVLQNQKGLFFLNTKDKFTSDFIRDGYLEDLSFDGNKFIVRKNNILYKYEYVSKQNINELIVKQLKDASYNYKFYNSSDFLIYNVNSDLYISDTDGENVALLLESKDYLKNYMIVDNKELLIVINNYLEDGSNFNLYKINLTD